MIDIAGSNGTVERKPEGRPDVIPVDLAMSTLPGHVSLQNQNVRFVQSRNVRFHTGRGADGDRGVEPPGSNRRI
jgi:hypothetical protein